jgi:hypothetical protein
MHEGLCYSDYPPDCVVECPISLQILRDDFALLETEYVGTATCHNHSSNGNLQYGFYRPGCGPSTCGA